MDIEKHVGKEKLPSILKDPFVKTHIKKVYVNYREFCGKWEAYGEIGFMNGNTTGTQKFNGDTFDDVVAKIKAFVNELD